MTTLPAFLLARLAEDEANVDYPSRFDQSQGDFRVGWGDVGAIGDVLMIGEARLRAEVAAKRAILEEHPDYGGYGKSCATCAESGIDLTPWPCPTLRHLASVYRDHPDFDEGWAL